MRTNNVTGRLLAGSAAALVVSALVAPAANAAGPATAPVDLRFEYQDASGLKVLKQFHLEPASFVVALTARVETAGHVEKPVVQWGPGLGDVEGASRSAQPPGGLLSVNGSQQRLTPAAIAKQAAYENAYEFAGVTKLDVVVNQLLWAGEKYSLKGYAKVDNLLNQRYYENGFRSAGGTFLTGLQVLFK